MKNLSYARKIFKRKIYERMLRWKQESNGHTALLIKGARRVGKSTIAKEFACQEYKSYIIIDFSIADDAVKELFSHISDLNYFSCGFNHCSTYRYMNGNRSSFSMKYNYILLPDRQSNTL